MAFKPTLTRRQFTRRTIAASATAVAAPIFVPQTAFGANDRLNVAAIGAGGATGIACGPYDGLGEVRLIVHDGQGYTVVLS